MKKLFPFIASLLLPSISLADVSSIEGRFNCKINFQQVVKTNDGRPEIYNGFEGDVSVGDNVSIYYYLEHDAANGDFKLGLRTTDEYRPGYSYLSIVTVDRLFLDVGFFGVIAEDGTLIYLDRNEIRFSENSMNATSMRRYYKEDWEALDVQNWTMLPSPMFHARIQTLDCTHQIDRVEEIQNLLKENFL